MSRAATAVATLGPVGYWPWGPGTVASAITALVWMLPWPWWTWLTVVLIAVWVGGETADRAEKVLGPDDGRIVIDEVAGMGIALLAAPHTWTGAGIAFGLFRLLDIVKPPPVGRAHRAPGGWGVMLDDVVAGAFAAGLLALGRWVV